MNRGRFAPTPSGELHIGNAMTALISWWQIRQSGGEFVLRMEDLDRQRTYAAYGRQMITDLKWLGIDWDEGPDVSGPYEPYDQGSRNHFYEDAFNQLNRDGRLYPCYCSRKALKAVARAPHGLSSLGPAYPGFCRNLTAEEQAKKAREKNPSFRFIMPDHAIIFSDLTAGKREYPPGTGGDFAVKRADGVFSYQLAVVVDDAAMKMTHILRGDDLLDSTPRQMLLYEALGLPVPQFTHVPLLYGPDGQRLSKRHGSWATLTAVRENGTNPEVVVGLLAYLSGQIDAVEPIKAKELIPDFDLAKIPKEPIRLEQPILEKVFG